MKTSANDWATRQRIERERAAWVAEHGPACQICGTVPKTRGLQWDHDHKTKAHRGWLCHRCNRALPNWITINWLLSAAAYLFKGKIRYQVEDDGWITQTLVHGPDSPMIREDAFAVPGADS